MNFRKIVKPAKKGIANILARRPVNSSTEIRLTRLCTQRCRQCNIYNKSTEPPTVNPDDFALMARRLRDYGAYVGFISGGEPTLVPHLNEMLHEAVKTFPVAVTLNTGLYNTTKTIEHIAEYVLRHNINIQTSLDGLNDVGDDLRGVPEFSRTVLKHMEVISEMRRDLRSHSLLYVNIVLNNLNMDQIPEMIHHIAAKGWDVTVGLYHTVTSSTKNDEALRPVLGQDLDRLIAYLIDHPRILTLKPFLQGIKVFLDGNGFKKHCPFLTSPLLATRLTIMETGDVHLCRGEPIGNILKHELREIFSDRAYTQRLSEYRRCSGCWTSCYIQRSLLLHPRTPKEFLSNMKKVLRARRAVRLKPEVQ
ncbi:MAG: radical SAM protein [Gemmatimonadota bacterium]|nr:MAG: radical SAM protein [Gemmatimonadota bacterium]